MIYEEVLLYHFPEFKTNYLKKLESGEGICNHILENANKDYVQFESLDDELVQDL